MSPFTRARITLLFCTVMLVLTSCIPVPIIVEPEGRFELYTFASQRTYEVHTMTGMGSAWAFDDTHLITNWHVLEDGFPGWAEMGSEVWIISEVEKLPYIDACLITIDGPPLLSSKCGDDPQLGDFLFMSGSPHNTDEPVITWGFLSGTYIDGSLIVDGAIIPGMSGGPVYNQDCEVVGMCVATTLPPGRALGLFIPISEILYALDELGREREVFPSDNRGGHGDPSLRRRDQEVP